MYKYEQLPASLPSTNVGLGYCDGMKASLIFDLVRKSPLPHFAVEIGVHFASSLVVIGAAVNGLGTCIGIDPYIHYVQNSLPHAQKQLNHLNQENTYQQASIHIRECHLDECTQIIRDTSKNYSVHVPASITFLNIDGNHDYEYVKKDIELYTPKVIAGGYVLCDDTNFPDVLQAVQELLVNSSDWTRISIYTDNMMVFQRL